MLQGPSKLRFSKLLIWNIELQKMPASKQYKFRAQEMYEIKETHMNNLGVTQSPKFQMILTLWMQLTIKSSN